MRARRSFPLLAALLLALLWAAPGCATTKNHHDPLEKVNRVVYKFNDQIDAIFFKPVSDIYTGVVPEFARTGVSNFFDNLGYPWVILNDLLQAKIARGAGDLARLAINSTVGVGGLIDVATPIGLPHHEEDLGQTLAVWGLPEGPYLVLPIFGPSTLRDVPDLIATQWATPSHFIDNCDFSTTTTILGGIDQRARASSALKIREQSAVDPYVFTREGYRQHRKFLIYNGNPPTTQTEVEDYGSLLEQAGTDEGTGSPPPGKKEEKKKEEKEGGAKKPSK